MIYTITLNPSVDYVMYTEEFETGSLNRAHKTQKFAGGKGINVSRVLQALDIPSVTLGFIGGYPGQMIEETLHSSGIETSFIKVEADTRINVKIKGANETEVNAAGPYVDQIHFQSLLKQLEQLTKDDMVILAGSIPSSLSHDTYAQIAERIQSTGAQLIVDAEKSLIESILPYHPLLIKPNLKELEDIFDVTISENKDVRYYAEQLIKKGAQSVLVSLGSAGALYVDHKQAYQIKAPKGKVINTVGAGDSTVAGYIAGHVQRYKLNNILALAIASGSATAFNEDLAQRDDIEQLKNQVNITKLEAEG
ncbi:1-phosphofructokinase [Staphylococcus canis]|uniref:Tagatose-6-phosphate kinase n=1 Tax=Staphylococcus canis TaxID=2724942 RepID=A0ABS0T6M1_9STAP|nr:1-phosphofructokinase [Staphylococcus canis]MBI5974017.1 1-phosphofructokinase [Staphylococcus canis]